MDLEVLKEALRAGRIVITPHASTEARADNLNLTEIRGSVIDSGEIIEDYPSDRRGPSCLVLSFFPDGTPVHSCWGHQRVINFATLITVYRPAIQPHKWTPDWRTRTSSKL